jgi:hypothetical protein
MTDIFTVLVFWWVVTLHGAVGRYNRFGGTYYLCLRAEHRGSMSLQNVSIYLQVNTAF